MEYKNSFLADQIDFLSFIGPRCPICGALDCYRQITPYWRYAIDLFPDFKKDQVPIARFLCRRKRQTFSLLPIQLIPYFQYTAAAVIGTLLLAHGWWQKGQRGFFRASLEIDPDSLTTPYLIAYWMMVIVQGFRRAHHVLKQFYDLTAVHTSHEIWEEVGGYFTAFDLQPRISWGPPLSSLLHRYSASSPQFLFGTPSQYRPPCRS